MHAKHPTKKQSKHELRVSRTPQKFEVRRDANGRRTISGYFAKFDSLSSDLGGFVERIKPGAFAQSLKDYPDLLCYYNHDSGAILGRVSSGTLTVNEDSIGLRFKVTLPDTSYANDLITLMERGDVSACSFGFIAVEDDWQMVGDRLTRTLIRVDVFEGSIVGQPAYPNTVADLRSCPANLREKLKRSDDDDDDDDCGPGQHFDEAIDECVDDDDDDTDDEDRCGCGCEFCIAGDCSQCSNPNCIAEQCTKCPAQTRAAHRKLLALRAR